jgi:hypothetical protein
MRQHLTGFDLDILRRVTDGGTLDPPFDDPLDAGKRPAADKQDVAGIDGDELLLRVLSSTLRGDMYLRAFEQLEQSLLYPLSTHITGDGRVIAFAGNLVDFIDEDDAALSLLHFVIGNL